MKSLIIGAEGFVGGYLVAETAKRGEVFTTERACKDDGMCGKFALDIRNKSNMSEILGIVKPDVIYHLAAQSSVALSWQEPVLTTDVNIIGSINLLECIRELDYKPRVILVGSSEEYGNIKPENNPIRETEPCDPQNIYAITKLAQNRLGTLYAKAYGLNVVMTRAFNHVGIGQADNFVIPSFCRQLAEITHGKREPVIYVGNLSAKRDFTDVRDIVRAYVLLAEKGMAGETYNIGSGNAIAIHEILNLLIKFSGLDVEICVDPSRYRPVDVSIAEADISKFKETAGWEPEISLKRTLNEVLKWKMG
jgi:GDP-4-dehydro-6-deoxy-D-mannose reductase